MLLGCNANIWYAGYVVCYSHGGCDLSLRTTERCTETKCGGRRVSGQTLWISVGNGSLLEASWRLYLCDGRQKVQWRDTMLGKITETWPRWWMPSGLRQRSRLVFMLGIRDFHMLLHSRHGYICTHTHTHTHTEFWNPRVSNQYGWVEVLLLLQVLWQILFGISSVPPSLTCSSNLQDQNLQNCVGVTHLLISQLLSSLSVLSS